MLCVTMVCYKLTYTQNYVNIKKTSLKVQYCLPG